jgi:N-acyl-phosphatidylethanolamine-hydrolysing phospholipase D
VQDVRALNSVAIHCSTFSLADEPLDEPPMLLAKSVREARLPADAFITLQHGGLVQAAGGNILNKPPTLASGPIEVFEE